MNNINILQAKSINGVRRNLGMTVVQHDPIKIVVANRPQIETFVLDRFVGAYLKCDLKIIIIDLNTRYRISLVKL